MSIDNSIEEIVKNLIELQNSYSTTYRVSITKERYQRIPWQQIFPTFLECDVLREPLLEHVGHLPVIATYLHPLIKQSHNVDLGKSLIMLSLHDIGETVTGDIPPFTKNNQHQIAEREAVKAILSEKMLKYFDEYETQETFDAKFAKSVDILSPMLHHLSQLDVSAVLYQHIHADLDLLWQRKREYMKWDSFLLEMFDYCTETIRPTLLSPSINPHND